jgi:hypothetical protein
MVTQAIVDKAVQKGVGFGAKAIAEHMGVEVIADFVPGVLLMTAVPGAVGTVRNREATKTEKVLAVTRVMAGAAGLFPGVDLPAGVVGGILGVWQGVEKTRRQAASQS